MVLQTFNFKSLILRARLHWLENILITGKYLEVYLCKLQIEKYLLHLKIFRHFLVNAKLLKKKVVSCHFWPQACHQPEKFSCIEARGKALVYRQTDRL